MAETTLKEKLQIITGQYGIKRVERALRKLQPAADKHPRPTKSGQLAGNGNPLEPSRPTPKPRKTALSCLAKLDVSAERLQPLRQLAQKFDDKEFLPTVGEVRNFYEVHDMTVPGVSSRLAAMSRVFRFLSTLPADDLQAMVQSHAFSGPSRLAPLADAIARHANDRMPVGRAADMPPSAGVGQ